MSRAPFARPFRCQIGKRMETYVAIVTSGIGWLKRSAAEVVSLSRLVEASRQTTRRPLTNRTRNSTIAMTSST